MSSFYAAHGIYDEEAIMRHLPHKHRKSLLLSMYKPQLVRCPLFAGMKDVVITTIAMLMQPYMAVQEDVIFNEDEVGSDLYIIISGEIELSSLQYPKFNGLTWMDGAFIGELPLIGSGSGQNQNRHVYTATAIIETDLTYLPGRVLSSIEADYPELSRQVRRLAAKRAGRFGVPITR